MDLDAPEAVEGCGAPGGDHGRGVVLVDEDRPGHALPLEVRPVDDRDVERPGLGPEVRAPLAPAAPAALSRSGDAAGRNRVPANAREHPDRHEIDRVVRRAVPVRPQVLLDERRLERLDVDPALWNAYGELVRLTGVAEVGKPLE